MKKVIVTKLSRAIRHVVSRGAQGPRGGLWAGWADIPDKPDFDALYDPLGAASAAQSAAAADATTKVSAHEGAVDPHAQYALDTDLSGHTGNTENPHSVTKAQVGLGNVDNTSDASKPVSTAQQNALNGKEPTIAAGTSAQFWRGDKTWADFAANVRMTVLTGLSTASASVITAADSVLGAIGKLQAQISDVITQTEAETGTSTTRRSWTSQRVRQATAAWWLAASSALGRTLASIADAAAGRTALGLGSASVLAAGKADAALPTNSDIRAYYGIKGKPSVAPTLVIDFENSYFAIYNAATNSLFVADNWDAFATHLGADLTISRAGEQTYFDALGVMRTAAANTVQCDHDPLTGQRLGPYFGGARTNLLLSSEAPATQSVSVTAQAYTLSFYGTGSVTLSGAHSATLSGSGAYPVRSTLTFTPGAGTLTLTVSGTVQKFQLEAGSDASPYIPTVGAAVTRPAAHMRIAGAKFTGMCRLGAGTVVIDAQANSTASFYASISDGTNAERISITTGPGLGGNVNAVVTTGVVLQAEPIVTAVPTARHRIALSYVKDAVSLSVDGSAPATDTSASIPTAMTMFIIGAYSNLNGALGGNVRYVALYPLPVNTQELSK